MKRFVKPGPRTGTVRIPASKSQAHRLLICAALSGGETELRCGGVSKDIQATMDCLNALGASIHRDGDILRVNSVNRIPGGGKAILRCGESGSTLRFLLPVVGALGAEAAFMMEGRLPQRPLQPLWDVLEAHGMFLSQRDDRLFCSGKLLPGEYEIPGNVSSQYVSGMLFALPWLGGESTLRVTGKVESADYIAMTEAALKMFGIPFEKDGWTYRFSPTTPLQDVAACASENSPLQDVAERALAGSCDEDMMAKAAPEAPGPEASTSKKRRCIEVESDWSSASFFLAMGAFSAQGVTVREMNFSSAQGDRRILDLLRSFGADITEEADAVRVRRSAMKGLRIDAANIPDLVPILAVIAAAAEGETVIEHAERLRLKESDRLLSTTALLSDLGGDVRMTDDGLIIHGNGSLRGGTISSFNDHRIAMSAAAAASLCRELVEVDGAECTEKSFPGFWELLESLTEDI